MIIYFIICGLIASVVLTYLSCIYSLKFDVLAHPSNRCAHSVPTPRGGGLAIAITLLAMLMYAGFAGLMNWQEIFTIALPGGLVAAIGFTDDHRPVQISHRLFIHFAAASLAVMLLPSLPTISFGALIISSPIILYPVMVIGLVWLLNLYNFMDGIDGIASSEAISILLSAAVILHFTNDTYWSQILLWSCAPIAGFLVWNWPPAKIFMGDVGSGFLGIFIGILALLTSADSLLTPWSWLILLAVFIGDAAWSLLVRITTGQAWHQPHSSHAYQILARKKQSHAVVSLGVVVINIGWLAPLAWLATIHPHYGWALTFLAYLPILYICWINSAGLLLETTSVNTVVKKDFHE